jgi:hypothetical protein
MEDPEGGARVYVFDIYWRETPGLYPGRYSAAQTMRLDRDEVRQRAARNIDRDIEFLNTEIDTNVATHDRIIVKFDAPESGDRYQFFCSMRTDGSLRSLDIEPFRSIYGEKTKRAARSSPASRRSRSAAMPPPSVWSGRGTMT